MQYFILKEILSNKFLTPGRTCNHDIFILKFYNENTISPVKTYVELKYATWTGEGMIG